MGSSSTAVQSERGGWRQTLLAAQKRERDYLVGEFSKVRGLMPLLMKRRNGGRWQRGERQQLVEQLRALMHLSPYLVVLALPGSVLLLPVLAWWLDRRRQRRRSDDASSRDS